MWKHRYTRWGKGTTSDRKGNKRLRVNCIDNWEERESEAEGNKTRVRGDLWRGMGWRQKGWGR